MQTKLSLITEIARRDRNCKINNAAYFLNAKNLKECFMMLKKGKASGIDGISVEDYEKNLDENLGNLVEKMKRQAYKPHPVRRTYIPKANGNMRPLGIPSIEDKIVQTGIARILEAIYEVDFLDFSYGFRPNRNCHLALKQLDEVIMTKPIKPGCSGIVELVRYADDFVICVQYKDEAEKILEALKERLGKFHLEFAEEKTRIIEFGRYAKINANAKGKKPETFNFLGFTHFIDKTRKGKFKLGRKTERKKMSAKLKEINLWLKSIRNMYLVKEWWKMLIAKLRGYFQYYGVSGNYRSISKFYYQIILMTFKWLNRRSQKKSFNWNTFWEYLKKHELPKPKIHHDFYTGFGY